MTQLPSLSIDSLTINADRLIQRLNELATIGQLDTGGVCRLAFSEADIQARLWIQQRMVDGGMTVRVDAAGNLIGRYAGTQDDLPALATGSHIDTVPVAGKFDGCLGVLAGIEGVQTLSENHLRLRHPIEVIVFTDEERSVIGSKAMAGELLDDPALYARLDGTSIETCLKNVGGNWTEISTAKRFQLTETGEKCSDLAAFVELHVEQGGVLEAAGAEIGVVTGVVGQYRFAVTIVGQANHAGTTSMNARQDALLAAAQLVVAVNQIATASPGDQVATVGYLMVSPNATNTIAGQVDLRIDLRDLFQAHLEGLVAQIRSACEKIAQSTGTEITLQPTLHIQPTLAAPQIMAVIENVANQLQLPTLELPSRAGHDAQEIGRITDMGMIFVPSRSGISHSVDEYTSNQQCVQGAMVLLKTLIQLDNCYD
ncbi:Zn-dependent hydrolase [Alkalinema pantanalense CENA528]|uniref:Zn-dependent hydrolase n=1 Tax=Alkalinema pantanalense TaxID=1620705 RepID=UPI003D6FC7D7